MIDPRTFADMVNEDDSKGFRNDEFLMSTDESAFRRGVDQALNMAADLAEQGVEAEDIVWLCNQSGRMRCEQKDFPAYIDELKARLKARIERIDADWDTELTREKVLSSSLSLSVSPSVSPS